MKFGVFLPVSGRAASRKTLMQAAQQAEALGYDSVWAADRLVIPWKIETTYPYSKEATFIVPPDRPFFDTMTCLAFLAGCTETIELGMSVMVLPYRHPLHWSRIATTIDQLSTGRLILGVGVGWMEEEFAAMNAPFKERGKVSDEQLTLSANNSGAKNTSRFTASITTSMTSPFYLSLTDNRACRSGSAAKANTPSVAPVDTATRGFRTSSKLRPKSSRLATQTFVPRPKKPVATPTKSNWPVVYPSN